MLAIRLLKSLFLPPSSCLAMALLGLGLVASGHQILGLGWMAAGVGCLAFFSLPVVGTGLLSLLDRYPVLPPEGPLRGESLEGAEALIVLDGGGRRGAREYGGSTVKNETLERLRYGAFLAQRTGLPLMVSGNGFGRRMGQVLTTAFGMSARWCEEESRNTWENAQDSAAILRREGIQRVILVTHFWHMPRAVGAFQRAGFNVVPAPMGFRGAFQGSVGRVSSLLPGVAPLGDSYLFFHEIVGLAWYRLRYGIGPIQQRN